MRLGYPAVLLAWLLLWGGTGSVSAQAPWQFVAGSMTTSPPPNNYSLAYGTATDSSGNVFVTGTFGGQVSFGTDTLVSAGNSDMYLAKWDVTTGAWAWAISGGGTTSWDVGYGVAVSGHNVYVTGEFNSNVNNVIAGTSLPWAGDRDMFVAKYIDHGTTVSSGWAVSGGGPGQDIGQSIAVAGTSVYVTGFYETSARVFFAGVPMSGYGSSDMFLVKYTDHGTTVSNGWVTRGGSTGGDGAYGVAVRDSMVYVIGDYWTGAPARVGGTILYGAGYHDVFVARYVDRGSTFGLGGAIGFGGTGPDHGTGIAVSGPNVYVTGNITTASNAVVAGTPLPGAGGHTLDMFVAKYLDTGTGWADGWATSGGGVGDDQGTAIAVSGPGVFVTGCFNAYVGATVAGTALPAGRETDMYLAQYLDMGPGYRDGWALSGGGPNPDVGSGLALSGANVYVAGVTSPGATFGAHTLAGSPNSASAVTFLTGLNALSVRMGTEPALGGVGFTLAPNPAHHSVRLTGATSATAEVVDALGRTVRTLPLEPGTANLSLQGLPPGLYVVRCGAVTRRLVVE